MDILYPGKSEKPQVVIGCLDNTIEGLTLMETWTDLVSVYAILVIETECQLADGNLNVFLSQGVKLKCHFSEGTWMI